MGASGSGKSTFMNILGFLDQPTSGQYLLEESAVKTFRGMSWRRFVIGRSVLSSRVLIFYLRTSALENVELPLIYSGTPISHRKEMAKKALSTVGLEGRGHHHPNQLSGGEQQSVAIARAWSTNPPFFWPMNPQGISIPRRVKRL